jgi:hypothetical protein
MIAQVFAARAVFRDDEPTLVNDSKEPRPMKKILLLAALAAFAAPMAFAAQGGAAATTPSTACKAELQKMGAADFKSLYAPNGTQGSAMGKCVSSHQKSAAANRVSAQNACAAERDMAADAFKTAHDGKSFNEVYGKNANDRNAFGKCVSAKASAKDAKLEAKTLKASATCKTERGSTAESKTAFNAKYGGKKNAFGKCVSQHAKSA